MADSIVQQKIARLIQRELSEILLRGHAPAGGLVTLSVVRVSPDLEHAKAYLSVFPDALLEETVESYNAKHWQLRHELSGRIRSKLRKMPELRFYADDSGRESERINRLLDSIRPEGGWQEKPDDEAQAEE